MHGYLTTASNFQNCRKTEQGEPKAAPEEVISAPFYARQGKISIS
jgi:hypothetical protein